MKPNAPAHLGCALTRTKLDALIHQSQLSNGIRGDMVALACARCKGPVICAYLSIAGEIVIECAECRRPVCRIKVHDPAAITRN